MAHPYRHTQIGYVMIAALGGAAAVASYFAGRTEVSVPLPVAVVLGAVFLLFSTLTTVVEGETFEIYFGPGLIRRRIKLHDIRHVRVVRNPWYCGWGIRLMARGWLWNVSGLWAVELELRDGRRFRAGTDDPGALAAALRRD